MHLATSNVHVVTGSNLTIQSKYGTSRILDSAAQLVTDQAPCFTAGTRYSGIQASVGDFQTQNWPDVGNNVKDDSSDHIMYFQSSAGQVL